jgi:hypothetical protein
MKRLALFLLVIVFAGGALAAEIEALTVPANRIAVDDPAWKELAVGFSRRPDATAEFSEQRFFPFRRAPVELKGESRVSATRGLSLHYTAPEERIVILDTKGMLVRDKRGETSAPDDPRAAAANAALVEVLRFDLTALDKAFELYGQREGAAWKLAFVPRAASLRRSVGVILVAGMADALNRIEIRRAANQHIDIKIGPPRATPFAEAELKRFFR